MVEMTSPTSYALGSAYRNLNYAIALVCVLIINIFGRDLLDTDGVLPDTDPNICMYLEKICNDLVITCIVMSLYASIFSPLAQLIVKPTDGAVDIFTPGLFLFLSAFPSLCIVLLYAVIKDYSLSVPQKNRENKALNLPPVPYMIQDEFRAFRLTTFILFVILPLFCMTVFYFIWAIQYAKNYRCGDPPKYIKCLAQSMKNIFRCT